MRVRDGLVQKLDMTQLEARLEAVAIQILGNNILIGIGPLVEYPGDTFAKLRRFAGSHSRESVRRQTEGALRILRNQVIAIPDGTGACLVEQCRRKAMVPQRRKSIVDIVGIFEVGGPRRA